MKTRTITWNKIVLHQLFTDDDEAKDFIRAYAGERLVQSIEGIAAKLRVSFHEATNEALSVLINEEIQAAEAALAGYVDIHKNRYSILDSVRYFMQTQKGRTFDDIWRGEMSFITCKLPVGEVGVVVIFRQGIPIDETEATFCLVTKREGEETWIYEPYDFTIAELRDKTRVPVFSPETEENQDASPATGATGGVQSPVTSIGFGQVTPPC